MRWASMPRADGDVDKEYHYIAMIEHAAIVLGIKTFAETIRGRDILWFIDNVVVLAGLAKGHSKNYELDAANASIQPTLAHMHSDASMHVSTCPIIHVVIVLWP